MRTANALVLLCTLLSLLVAFLFVTQGAGAADPRDGLYWDAEVARYVRGRVSHSYVDRLTPEQQKEAFYRALDAYVDFDDYSTFIRPREVKQWEEEISGQYAGLGVRIQPVEDGLLLAGVLPGGPAAQAGLSAGDTLTSAEGVRLADLPFDDVTLHLKGKPKSQVRVRYLPGPRPETGPPAGPEKETVVTRDIVSPPTIFSRRLGPDDRFGLVRLKDFAEGSASEFDRQVDAMRKAGIQGLIIDLRGNGGGVLSTALQITDRFLSKGVILRREGRGTAAHRRDVAHAEQDDITDLPLVVLVDRGSASASEVVAGALQDHRRALLVGERTYGKFLVQQITEIPGSRAALKLTTSRYYTPNGRSYQSRRSRDASSLEAVEPAGLFPDVTLAYSIEERRRLLRAFDDEEGVIWGIQPPETSEGWEDRQLQRAIQSLMGETILKPIRARSTAPRNG